MTTIAYKDGIIAYDSQQTAGDTITNNDAHKGVWIEGVFFVFSGAVSDFPRFVETYFGRASGLKHVDCSALIFDNGKLYRSGHDNESGIWKQEMDRTVPAAIGSGWHFAYAAMDCGLSAVDAVRAAAKRDAGTGGAVRYFDIETKNIVTAEN